jgi:long-chain acyl-CoA synthetase
MAQLFDQDGTNVGMLLGRLAVNTDKVVLWERGQERHAGTLLQRMAFWADELKTRDIGAGTVCAIAADYELESIALMLALMKAGAIVMPVSYATESEWPKLVEIAGAKWLVRFSDHAAPVFDRMPDSAQNHLIEEFRASYHPGLIVFSSGSSGEPKGILHDFERVLEKFLVPRPARRTILFLTFDHFGGINTLFGGLMSGGVNICVGDRSPETVCRAIEGARAELLPATPTFLKLLLASGASSTHDLSSLQYITYGAEPMAESTLARLSAVFPNATLKQTYGLSELGVLHSRSRDRESLWLSVGGQGFETRIVDGVLQIRSVSNMVGYLNAPNPIDRDGWMDTGDLVEQQDGYIRFLGRKSEIINVGALKVFPAEVENTLVSAEGVADATVYATPHPLLGQALCARVSLLTEEPVEAAIERLRAHCRERLAKFKVPMRFEIVRLETQSTQRNKKYRPPTSKAPIQ